MNTLHISTLIKDKKATLTPTKVSALFACLLFTICFSYSASALKRNKESSKEVFDVVRKSTNKIWFEQNAGQFSSDVLYGFRTSFGSMGVYQNKLRISAVQKNEGDDQAQQIVDITFPGSTQNWTVVPKEQSVVKGSYNNVNGQSINPTIFNEITLKNVYPGIDLRLYSGDKGALEFDWLVAKASDYKKIKMNFDGQDNIIKDQQGNIVLDLRFQDINIVIPETYQMIHGKKKLFETTMYANDNNTTLSYALTGHVQPDAPLVIDPVMQWSTYFDNNEVAFDEYAYSIHIGANDEVYVGGLTNRVISASYMSGVSAGYSASNVGTEAIIYRLNPNGTAITAWTMTGAGSSNRPADMGIFPDGRVLVGYSNGLIQIFSAELSSRIYSAEPFNVNAINSVQVIDNDVFYASGTTAALAASLLSGAPDATFGGTSEGFIARYQNATSGTPAAQWVTYVGGNNTENFAAISLSPDKSKVAFAVQTSGGSSFPTLANQVDGTIAGSELVVGVLPQQASMPTGFNVLSFLGGAGDEGDFTTVLSGITVSCASALVACDSNYFYVAGNTASTDLPGTTGSSQTTSGGNMDQFITRISYSGGNTGFVSTYMGGSGEDLIGGLLVEPRSQTVLLFGTTTSTNYPVQNTNPASDYFQSTFGGAIDATYSNFSKDLSTREFSTYIGGSEKDYLGNTGVLTGSGHLSYNPNTGSAYIATTIHTVETNMPAQWMSGLPGFDKSTDGQTAGNDQHFIFGFNPSTFDFGDAPSGYEAGNQAKSVVTYKIKIGSDVDAEGFASSNLNADGDDLLNSGVADDEDGISVVPPINEGTNTYQVEVSVFNNSGASVLLHGWIDANSNGLFDASEYASVNVASSATQQTVTLIFSSLPNVINTNGTTYMRLRMASVPMTSADATGGFGSGEVEDYKVNVTVQLAGTIFKDNDGLANGLIDGTGTNLYGLLFVNLVDNNGNVVASTPVASDGTYSFDNVPSNASYTLSLSNTAGTVNAPAPSANLPKGWTNVGEGTAAAGDGVVDGNTSVAVGLSSISGINFGIIQQDANPDINQTIVNTPVTGSVATNDDVRPGSTFTAIGNMSHGTLVMNPDGSYVYTPENGFVGTDAIQYVVCSTLPPVCDTTTLTIVVTPLYNNIGNTIIAQDDHATTPMNTDVIMCILCNDSDPNNNTIQQPTITTNPAHGTVTVNANGTVTYSPTQGYYGTDVYTYQICDDGSPVACTTANAYIDIVPLPLTVNQTYANDDAYTTPINVPKSGNVSLNDSDPQGDAVTFTQVNNPSHGTVIFNSDGTFIYTPNQNYTGPDQFIYSKCDNGNPVACDTATVYITINKPYQDVQPDINQTIVNIPVHGTVETNDNVLPGSTFTPLGNTSHGTTTLNADGTYLYTPDPGFVGRDSMQYIVCSPSPVNLCDTTTLTIIVTPLYTNVDNIIIAQDDYATTPINTAVNMCIKCNDSDPNGDEIGTPVILSNPAHGTVVVNADGTATYTPDNGFTGTDVYTYAICDNGSPQVCDTADAYVTITPVPLNINQTYANDDAYVTQVNTPKSGNVGLNDTDPQGDAVTFTQESNPAHGSVVFNADGTFTYTPDSNYTGPDEFIYSKCDNGSPVACDKATVYITMLSLLPQTGLPVSLTNFYGIEASCMATLYWTTSQEEGFSHFEIEKKNEQNQFVKIGQVAAAAGSSHSTKEYSFKDLNIHEGVNEYRLRIVDIDQKFAYSKNVVITSSCDGEDLITLFPNPSSSSTNVLIRTQQENLFDIRLIDINGQTLYQTSFQVSKGSQVVSIPTQHLPVGIYNVLVSNGNELNVIRFVKEGK